MSEILQNIDAVLGIAMSVMALLGFGRFFGGSGQAASQSAAISAAPAIRRSRSRPSGFFRIGVLLAVFGIGAFLMANWFAGDRGFRGRGDGWRPDRGGERSGRLPLERNRDRNRDGDRGAGRNWR